MDGLISDDEQALSQITFTVEANSDIVHLGASFYGSDLILTTLVFLLKTSLKQAFYTTETSN